jgi:hypothetical protein
MTEIISNHNKILAIIIPENFHKSGIHFFTPDDFSQQLAYMNYSAGKKIQPHVHKHIMRKVTNTLEVLFLKKGKMRVDFYTDSKLFLKSRIIKAGDVILLASGGHGFEILEEIELIEVKQGPYVPGKDKEKFNP